MEQREIRKLVNRQRRFFYTGKTQHMAFREMALRRLQISIMAHEDEINRALRLDLGKSASEAYMCETGMVLAEISYMLKHMRQFGKNQTVRTPLAQFASRSFRKPSPYGVTLIMSPWNYPFLLTMEPLVDALAAGNTAIVKPSAYSPFTSEIMAKIISECLPQKYVVVVNGGRKENQWLLKEKFDYIFFTGSQAVGKEVMAHAAKHLTPVTLELGGKSPCIVDETANIKLAARRIVFGKYLNCGQTCVAPDYVLCDVRIRDRLVEAIREEIARQFGADPLQNPDYGKIINEKHFHRLLGLMDAEKIVCGGQYDEKTLRIAPTVMTDVDWSDAVMGEEIFGPILPVVTYNAYDTEKSIAQNDFSGEVSGTQAAAGDFVDWAIGCVEEHPHPLALYFFSEDKKAQRRILDHCHFGGGCINDTIIHLATSAMPFGGVGESGMGGYHGRTGFETFSHYRSIVDKKTWMDLPIRYQRYDEKKEKLLRRFLR